MRFAVRTSPRGTTWEAMLAVWRTADRIGISESGWTSDHFYPTHVSDLPVPPWKAD